MFEIKNTAIYQAIKLEKSILLKTTKFFAVLFFILSFIFLLLFLSIYSEHFLGQALICLGFTLLFCGISLFFNSKIKNPKLKYSISQMLKSPKNYNLASFLDFETAKICFQTIKAVERNKSREASKELFLYFLLGSNFKEINFIFGRAELSLSEIRKEVKQEISRMKGKWIPDFEAIILEAAKMSDRHGKEKIGVGDILIALSGCEPLAKILVLNNLKKEDIQNLVFWYERINNKLIASKRFWQYENLLKRGTIGRNLAKGYTITLDKYSKDLRGILKKSGFREIVGHKKEIKETERILGKSAINNVLLVGEPGSGRGSIVEAVAQKSFLGKSSSSVNYKRVLIFDIGQLIAETKSSENLEVILDRCFKQSVKSGNIILAIEEIQNFLPDISGVLSRYLPLSSFQIIAATSYRGLHNVLERNPAFLNLFEKVEISEISEKETLEFLENLIPFFEKKYKKFIPYKSLREILRLSSRYLKDVPFPEKGLRVLDEAISWLAMLKKENILKIEHIKKIVSEKTEIPLEDIEEKEKNMLLNLEGLIHERIINQEEAVFEISSSLRRARAEIQIRSGPVGSFMFLGPTGVGKTETAKALAKVYFGSERKIIRLDMSEFQTTVDIKRLIGDISEQRGLLTVPVRENPFSLILLDEIEKAHPNILNLFLQILDEGWVTDGFGRKIDFKSALIIATSNAGAEIIREDIRENKKLSIVKEDLLDYLFRDNIFRPEFINRFDAVVVFKPLTKENLLLICGLMLKKLGDNLRDKGIDFEITSEIKKKIVELSYSPQFGAREMKRVIQNKVENVLAEAVLRGIIKRGNKVKVEAENFSLVIK